MIPLQTASGHPVTHIAFSPDGATVAVAQPFFGVTLLERATGRTVGFCPLPCRAALADLVFCGGGRSLAVSSPKGVEVFDVATGTSVGRVLRGFYKNARLANRGGTLIGGGYVAGVRALWAPVVGREPSDLHARAAEIGGVEALSADGRFALLSGAGSCTLLFDLVAGRTVASVERHATIERNQRPPVHRFCPLGRRFALNSGRTLDVYDVGGLGDTGEQYPDTPLLQREFLSHYEIEHGAVVAPAPHAVLDSAFTLTPDKPEPGGWYPPYALLADGRGVLVKRPRNRVQLWDAPTGTLVNEWSWRLEWVTCVAASADGQTAVAGGRFGRVLLWDLD